MLFNRGILTIVILILTTAIVTAQSAQCSSVIEDAIAFTDRHCSETTKNQACYGNFRLTAIPQPNVTGFLFEEAGHRVAVRKIDRLLSGPFSLPEEWGVAMMKLQANLPNSVPNQAVTFLLFGEAEVSNQAIPAGVVLTGTSNVASNLRATPSTEGTIAGSVAEGAAITIDGRTESGDWIRVQQGLGEPKAWMSATLVTVDGTIDDLSVVAATDTDADFTPMQAFYFQSGIATNECVDAPQDGLLIQAPGTAQTRVYFRINEVDIELGSTALIRSVPGDYMTITMLEGTVFAEAFDVRVYANPGVQVRVPVDADGIASGPPEIVAAEAEEIDNIEAPVQLLEEEFVIATPLTTPEIDELYTPIDGRWIFAPTRSQILCSPVGILPLASLTVDITGNSLAFLNNATGEVARTATFDDIRTGFFTINLDSAIRNNLGAQVGSQSSDFRFTVLDSETIQINVETVRNFNGLGSCDNTYRYNATFLG